MSVYWLSSTGSMSPGLGCPPVSRPFQSQDFPECILYSPSFLPSSLPPFLSHLPPNLNLFLWVRIIYEKLNLLISTIFLPSYLAIAPLNRAGNVAFKGNRVNFSVPKSLSNWNTKILCRKSFY